MIGQHFSEASSSTLDLPRWLWLIVSPHRQTVCTRVQFYCVCPPAPHSLPTPTADTQTLTPHHPTPLYKTGSVSVCTKGLLWIGLRPFKHVQSERPVRRVNCNVPFKSRSVLWVFASVQLWYKTMSSQSNTLHISFIKHFYGQNQVMRVMSNI